MKKIVILLLLSALIFSCSKNHADYSNDLGVKKLVRLNTEKKTAILATEGTYELPARRKHNPIIKKATFDSREYDLYSIYDYAKYDNSLKLKSCAELQEGKLYHVIIVKNRVMLSSQPIPKSTIAAETNHADWKTTLLLFVILFLFVKIAFNSYDNLEEKKNRNKQSKTPKPE